MGCRIRRPTSGAGWQQPDKVHSKISLRINVFTEKYQTVSFISVALFRHFPPQERHSFVKHKVLIRQVNSNHLLSYSKKQKEINAIYKEHHFDSYLEQGPTCTFTLFLRCCVHYLPTVTPCTKIWSPHPALHPHMEVPARGQVEITTDDVHIQLIYRTVRLILQNRKIFVVVKSPFSKLHKFFESHFIRYTVLVAGWALFCFAHCLNLFVLHIQQAASSQILLQHRSVAVDLSLHL